jgi:hypothetical protein
VSLGLMLLIAGLFPQGFSRPDQPDPVAAPAE